MISICGVSDNELKDMAANIWKMTDKRKNLVLNV
jgi:hypothetical protein